ncbi:periplasmic heavy metal sensor [Marivivens donghaensis]|uniref:Periplasmic heavy metal sensor n=1 Tax=Marivivens donghaensis TaxID=1699413 RepID=A0ABX0VWD1_9RHOB|nr:periplasmic heavy metal sensor [Marivivens donghaensis]NIY72383.1 periplasmic heavy metal sensor [Marivivens donghaensis]
MTEKPKSRMRLGLRILLIASLALNMMIIGLVVGGIAKGKPPRSFSGGYGFSLGAVGAALDEDDRRALRDDLRGREDLRPPRREDLNAMRDAFTAAIISEPFDRSVLEALFTEQRDRQFEVMQAGQEAMLDRLDQMSADERKAFVERLNRRDWGRGGPDRDDH